MQEADWETLIEQNKDRIYRICCVYAVAPLEAPDLFQEVLIQSWRSYKTFQGKSTPATWIYRVALNVCMNQKLRIERTAKNHVQLESIHFKLTSEEYAEDPRVDRLKSCIGELNENEKSLVVLFLEEVNYKEIGEILGITENHVAVKMKRIRAKLLSCINKNSK